MERLQVFDYRPFGGENVDDVRQRTVSAVLDIITNNPGKNVGIICHNGPIRLLLFHFPDMPRIYRGKDTTKDIANTDIYEWDITDGKIANLKSLLKISLVKNKICDNIYSDVGMTDFDRTLTSFNIQDEQLNALVKPLGSNKC